MPTRSPQFDVLAVCTSDYSSQDLAGRPIWIGVHNGHVNLTETPPVLIPWFINVVLTPLEKQFSFAIDFDAPNGKRIIRINLDYSAETPLNEENRILAATQIPTIPFPGEGTYLIRVRDGEGETVYRHRLLVTVGPKREFNATINARAELNAEFKAATPS